MTDIFSIICINKRFHLSFRLNFLRHYKRKKVENKGEMFGMIKKNISVLRGFSHNFIAQKYSYQPWVPLIQSGS